MAKAKGSGATSDIDRLIEMGLNLYGAGDFESAIMLWEEALEIDPENAQATSYVEYVRSHYAALSGQPYVEAGDDAPHAIQEDPEYQIEIMPGEDPLAAGTPGPITVDPIDDGWFSDEQTFDASASASPAPAASNETDPEPQTLELEADEPPAIEMEADEPPSATNFDAGDTREYHGDVQRHAAAHVPKPEDSALDFGTAGPTTGFFRGDDTTQYADDDDDANDFADESNTSGFKSDGSLGFANIETEVRKRDFGFVKPTGAPKATSDAAPAATSDKPSSPISIGTAPTQDNIGHEATLERGPFMGAPPPSSSDVTDDDLLDGLPTPRPRPAASDPDSGEIQLSTSPTLNFPETMRVPADHPIVSAPTRELGLRGATKLVPPDDEDDQPTRESDATSIRTAARGEGTKHDIMLSFDPIEARARDILADVDAEAPQGEALDDQTRRRIARLVEKAQDWAEAGELDKAVSAIDLALSEDPSSALAQKLITRNKDVIMGLFQSFLGDLDRTPQLAKPLSELGAAPISPRAAFLLSRIDGMLTIDELLDVSGMPRLEAYRHLAQLFLRGILR